MYLIGSCIAYTDSHEFHFIYRARYFYHEKFLFSKIMAYVLPYSTREIKFYKKRVDKGYDYEIERFAENLRDLDYFKQYEYWGRINDKRGEKAKYDLSWKEEVYENIHAMIPYFRRGYKLKMLYMSKNETDPSIDGMNHHRMINAEKLLRASKKIDKMKVNPEPHVGLFMAVQKIESKKELDLPSF